MIPVFGMVPNLSGDFAHRLDALGAQNLVDLVTLFHHDRLLQVGFEGAVGGALGERAIVSEGCGLAAVGAFGHVMNFLSCYNSNISRLFEGTAFYHAT